MALQLKVPAFGESVVEGTIVRWLKQVGDGVKTDEPVVEIETDKITVEVPAPGPGVITKISRPVGDKVQVGEVIGEVDPSAVPTSPVKDTAKPAAKVETPRAVANAPAANDAPVMPAARRLAADQGVDTSSVPGTGRGGRVLKEDVAQASASGNAAPKLAPPEKRNEAPPKPRDPARDGAQERRVAMSPLRQRIAERLIEAQSNAAILTTFNECDMGAVMDLRKRYQEKFLERYGIKLGFMSFFVKAAVEALRAFPNVNAEIDGTDIVYKDYYDIGVAVGGGKGLVVPVIRGADKLAFAEIEKAISAYGQKAKENKLSLDDMKGGTFTISNGGIYGSLLSTPILNPPQSGILGMHSIQDRAMVKNGEVVVRPMMYLALSYDHRLVDGREAVSFLVRLKECIEDPERLLLEV
ncbi:MAG: 2-oxoglutarate dehydrogenase complex dihydrolipoyllysine-residue succinyltransferase [Deltaproteobacteria bacterium]|nr:2-oxoglutarate dehydrogenase complex dihydrolipoyllysine-residue succinyltransferase [Deltaproteobacteria bacterium]